MFEGEAIIPKVIELSGLERNKNSVICSQNTVKSLRVKHGKGEK